MLRQHMATLTEKDFEHGITNRLPAPAMADTNLEHQYRTHIMAMLQQPHVGGKRGIGAVNCPSLNFLLTTIERTNAIIVPPVWEESMATFIQWDSPANLYRDNRELKMRAFVTASVKLMMVDSYIETNAATARSDWLGYHLITAGSAYPVFKGELPPAVQKAYESGLLSLGRKILALGPKGEECDYEMSAAVALWYVARATGDADFTKQAESYARTVCTDPRFFNPAGYWTEAGGFDTGFGGMANFWTVWLALASDWPFAKEAVDRIYRLRAHLTLPEPDGKITGPSAFNSRLGSPACEDQWHWDGTRDLAAAMLTDEAFCLARIPTTDDLSGAMLRRTQTFNDHLHGLKNAPYTFPDGKRYNEKGEGRYLRNEELRGYKWHWRIFPNGYNYPVEVNPGYEFYRPGAYAHLAELQKQDSPMLKLPVLRPEPYLVTMGDAFISAKRPTFAAILHVGPVSKPAPGSGMAQYKGPMGFGGGQLAAFWTPEAGPALLARRSAITMRGTNTLCFDSNAVWRLWPIHAVSGCTADGKVFSSGRIASPVVTNTTVKGGFTAQVSGPIPAVESPAEESLAGRIDYARTLRIDEKAVRVETAISSDGRDSVAELYETIPVYLGDKETTNAAVSIELQVGGKWLAADTNLTAEVQAVRVTRFSGAVQIKFDKPQSVKLSPGVWQDRYLTTAKCRNVMIDLRHGATQPAPLKEPVRCAYTIAAAKPR